MLLRSSGVVYPNLFLITLGGTSRYAIVSPDGSYTLSDPGCSAHIPALETRLESMGLPLSKLARVIITHPHADRIGGLPLLRARCPQLRVCGTPELQGFFSQSENLRAIFDADRGLSAAFGAHMEANYPAQSELLQGFTVDDIRGDSELISIDDDTSVRVLITHGHTSVSCAFLLSPHHFLIADETFGYYRGAKLAAPGGDDDLGAAQVAISRIAGRELAGIGFPYGGAITGNLVTKHLENVMLNTTDLTTEVRQALRDGVSREEVIQQVRSAFYSEPAGDPCLQLALARSHVAVCGQIVRTLEESR